MRYTTTKQKKSKLELLYIRLTVFARPRIIGSDHGIQVFGEA